MDDLSFYDSGLETAEFYNLVFVTAVPSIINMINDAKKLISAPNYLIGVLVILLNMTYNGIPQNNPPISISKGFFTNLSFSTLETVLYSIVFP